MIRLTVAMNVATAVTFLGFYLSLVLVPAALAASVMSGVGPLAVAVLDLASGRPTTVAGWLRGSVLLAFSVLTALAMSTEGTRGTAVSMRRPGRRPGARAAHAASVPRISPPPPGASASWAAGRCG